MYTQRPALHHKLEYLISRLRRGVRFSHLRCSLHQAAQGPLPYHVTQIAKWHFPSNQGIGRDQIDRRGSSPGGRVLLAPRLEILSHVVGLSRAVREAFHFAGLMLNNVCGLGFGVMGFQAFPMCC